MCSAAALQPCPATLLLVPQSSALSEAVRCCCHAAMSAALLLVQLVLLSLLAAGWIKWTGGADEAASHGRGSMAWWCRLLGLCHAQDAGQLLLVSMHT